MVDLSYFHGVKSGQSSEPLALSEGLLTSPELRKKMGMGFAPDVPPAIVLSKNVLDEDAPAGLIVGRLSVTDGGEETWTFALADDAGGMFALADDRLLVGQTELEAGPVAIVIKAARGPHLIAAALTLTVLPAVIPTLDFSLPPNSQFIGQVI
ncbi:hypothetical protein [Rhizobium leguminosarum]|uniref:hypothetical protein n=1 Tax=Rhizobium leguminosarum TaxID=384 RepID=UPI000B925F8F|nr:hypothetical protein [Rhizobium leguminosarum]ASS56896.1 hypothetical protein CHR56_21365 [Rhizobium leguminosarum bv. viciae]